MTNKLLKVLVMILLTALILGIFFLVVYAVQALEDYRYLVIRQTYVFERGDELPYEVIRPMAYDDALGYIDIPIENAYREYVVVDLLTGNYAEVMASDCGCFAQWLMPEMGSDGQSHFASADWIQCDE